MQCYHDTATKTLKTHQISGHSQDLYQEPGTELTARVRHSGCRAFSSTEAQDRSSKVLLRCKDADSHSGVWILAVKEWSGISSITTLQNEDRLRLEQSRARRQTTVAEPLWRHRGSILLLLQSGQNVYICA
jgi:hypothetical protein